MDTQIAYGLLSLIQDRASGVLEREDKDTRRFAALTVAGSLLDQLEDPRKMRQSVALAKVTGRRTFRRSQTPGASMASAGDWGARGLRPVGGTALPSRMPLCRPSALYVAYPLVALEHATAVDRDVFEIERLSLGAIEGASRRHVAPDRRLDRWRHCCRDSIPAGRRIRPTRIGQRRGPGGHYSHLVETMVA